MNKRTILDVNTWQRGENFREYTSSGLGLFTVNTRLDVTNLVKVTEKTKTSFFINMSYIVLRELNHVENFRIRVENGNPVLYDSIDCRIRFMNDFGYYVNRDLEFAFYQFFYKNAEELIKQAKRERNIEPEGSESRTDIIRISENKYLDYVSYSDESSRRRVEDEDDRADSIPRVMWGQYTEENGRFMMTLSITAPCAVIEGRPLGDAIRYIKEALEKARL